VSGLETPMHLGDSQARRRRRRRRRERERERERSLLTIK
jgi:hypothetical protein